MFKKYIPLLILSSSLSYGFISVEPPVFNEEQGLKGEISLGAKYSSGNSDHRSLSSSIKGEYSRKDWLLYLISSYTYGESKGTKDTSDGMTHLRYIHKITDTAYDYETFYQVEFNAFQDLKTRKLVGANIRKKVDIYFDKLYFGLGLFYSYVEPESTNVNPIYRRTKANSYVSFLKKIDEHYSINYLGYYQPNVKDTSDYTLLQILQFNTSLSKNLNLSLDMIHSYNSRPYLGIKKSDIRSTLNLKYKL